ncbi:MAG: phosphorylase family protein [Dehalococcoidia bacterium]
MIAIVVALDTELSALERKARVRRSSSPVWPVTADGTLAGKQVLLARTGMGPARAREATIALIQRHEPEAILSLGFAGSLVSHLRAGQLVIARRVYALDDPADERLPAASHRLACDPALVELAVAAARRRRLAFREGASLTVPRVVNQPEIKRRIGDSLPVEVVEMESYWVGRVAADRGIPFLVVRAVLDEVNDRLPHLPNMIDDTGAAAWGRALRQLLWRPWGTPALIGLAASVRRASQRLAVFTEAFVDILAASPCSGREQ